MQPRATVATSAPSSEATLPYPNGLIVQPKMIGTFGGQAEARRHADELELRPDAGRIHHASRVDCRGDSVDGNVTAIDVLILLPTYVAQWRTRATYFDEQSRAIARSALLTGVVGAISALVVAGLLWTTSYALAERIWRPVEG